MAQAHESSFIKLITNKLILEKIMLNKLFYKKRIFIFSLFIAIFTVGCNSNSTKEESTSMSAERHQEIADTVAKVKKEVDGMIKLAEANQKKAKSVGGEWRDIGKLIKKAKKYQANGQCEKAIKTLQTAIVQGEMGYKQAMAQKDLKMPGYFHF
jgi:hypothetical protein